MNLDQQPDGNGMNRPIPGWTIPILALIALPVSLPLLVY